MHTHKRRIRWVKTIGIGLGAIVLPILLNFSPVLGSDAIATTFPPQCRLTDLPQRLQSNQLRFNLIAQTVYQRREYRLYEVTSPSMASPFPYVVKLHGKTCEGIYSNPMGDPQDYFHLAMPLPVARQLTLARLQTAIRTAGGLPAFRKQLEQTQQQFGRITQMAEEAAWAYQKVGLPLPPNVNIIPARPKR